MSLTGYHPHLVAAENDYLSELIFSAQNQELSQQREWHVLMHYAPAAIGSGINSLVDDDRFFLNENGKTNPAAELESTLHSFFQSDPVDDHSTHCRFPARFAWLKQKLAIDISYLPINQCKTLDIWLGNLSVNGITLVFPVAYLNNPASMFGHSFIRLDSDAKRNATDLLAWTVNFAARTGENRGLGYAVKGLFGQYKGTFTLEKYFFRVKEYGDLENRDMWEYQLDFTDGEIQKFLFHLWELLPVYFDYYFLDENCSFQLLSLLEAARPELKLSEQFSLDAIPANTVRAVNEVPGLLKHADFRPSGRNVLLSRASMLDSEHQQLAESLVQGKLKIHDPVFEEMNEQSHAQVLELAYEYIAYRNAVLIKDNRGKDKAAVIEIMLPYQLLSARSKLTVPQQHPDIPKPEVRPDQGHPTRRFGVQYGYEDPQHFLQMEFRWTYHDLFDPSGGYVEGAQIEIFKPAFRYYPEQGSFKFESFDFVDIVSSAPRSRFIKPISWKVSAAVQRERFDVDDRPLMGAFDGGVGLSYELTDDTLFSAYATAAIRFNDHFSQDTAIGAGGDIQLIHDLSERWRLGISAGVTEYFQGITQTSWQAGMQQRYSINKENAVVLDVGGKREFGDDFFFSTLSWLIYF